MFPRAFIKCWQKSNVKLKVLSFFKIWELLFNLLKRCSFNPKGGEKLGWAYTSNDKWRQHHVLEWLFNKSSTPSFHVSNKTCLDWFESDLFIAFNITLRIHCAVLYMQKCWKWLFQRKYSLNVSEITFSSIVLVSPILIDQAEDFWGLGLLINYIMQLGGWVGWSKVSDFNTLVDSW